MVPRESGGSISTASSKVAPASTERAKLVSPQHEYEASQAMIDVAAYRVGGEPGLVAAARGDARAPAPPAVVGGVERCRRCTPSSRPEEVESAAAVGREHRGPTRRRRGRCRRGRSTTGRRRRWSPSRRCAAAARGRRTGARRRPSGRGRRDRRRGSARWPRRRRCCRRQGRR